MSTCNKVLWLEGMFLQPQHFQQHERYVENLLLQRLTMFGNHNWGISSIKINDKSLTAGAFSLEKCSGILPDGTPFDIAEEDNTLLALDIPSGVTDTVVNLVLPSKDLHKVEVGDEHTNNLVRYRIDSTEVMDYHIGPEYLSELQLGKLCLRLKLASEDCQGYTCLPVARIKESRTDKQIVLDEQFIPPCLDIYASTELTKYVRELQGVLQHRGEMLAKRLAHPEQASTSELSDFLFLQIINRYEPLLVHMARSSKIHPEQLFTLLLQFTGDLAVFTKGNRRVGQLPDYVHDDLHAAFAPLIMEVRRAFSVVLEQAAIPIKLEKRQYGIWVASVPDKELFSQARFVLAAYSSVPPETMRTRFPSQVKIASVEDIRTLVSQALPGIELAPLPAVPQQIPMRSSFIYFGLNQRNKLWPRLAKSGAIAFHIGGQFSELTLELWAVRG